MIAPQDHWHALIATAAAKAGKDMYCEKPLGVSVEEGQRIRDAVRKAQARVPDRHLAALAGQVPAGLRTGPQRLRRQDPHGRGGRPGPASTARSTRAPLDPQPVPAGFDWDMWRGPAPSKPYNPGRVAWPDWYLIWDYCAGFICNWGVHHLDIANWGCPQLGTASRSRSSAQAHVSQEGLHRQRGEVERDVHLRQRAEDDLHRRTSEQKPGCTRFIGDKGWVHVDRAGIWAEPESLLQVTLKPDDTHLYETPGSGEDVVLVKKETGDRATFRDLNHGENFLDCVRSRKDPISNVDATHVASYLGLIAEIAARLETRLKWDPKKEEFIGDREANKRLSRPMFNGWKL